MIIFVCDKCKTRTDAKRTGTRYPSDWRMLTFSIPTAAGANHIEFLLCPVCQDDLKLPKGDAAAYDLGDRLLEIIAEIVQDAAQL